MTSQQELLPMEFVRPSVCFQVMRGGSTPGSACSTSCPPTSCPNALKSTGCALYVPGMDTIATDPLNKRFAESNGIVNGPDSPLYWSTQPHIPHNNNNSVVSTATVVKLFHQTQLGGGRERINLLVHCQWGMSLNQWQVQQRPLLLAQEVVPCCVAHDLEA